MKDNVHLLNIHLHLKNTYNLNIKNTKSNMHDKWHKKGGTAMLILKKKQNFIRQSILSKAEIKETFTNQRGPIHSEDIIIDVYIYSQSKIHEAKILQNKWKIMGVCGTPLSQ